MQRAFVKELVAAYGSSAQIVVIFTLVEYCGKK